MRRTKTISRSGQESILAPCGRAPFGQLTKRSVAPGHRMPEEILRMPKVIADIAQCGGNVIVIPVSCMGTNYKCLRCELPTCNKCSVYLKKTIKDVEELKTGKSIAYCEAYDRDLKRAALGLPCVF